VIWAIRADCARARRCATSVGRPRTTSTKWPESEARAAMSAMVDNRLVTKVLGKEPGGIHVMYIDRFGKVVRL